ncbi:shikimate kinase [Butyrivibrio sp. WCD3002]|uniref:shikimate kinase n=1 Tax=Butyrivibrio sp. WCD3002 TaxID=1280676 RepID=UPI000402B86E|nr:shikimate kinase [Butyrivibrio sp. WCD3002]
MRRDIYGTTRVCGLIGNPVHHTISPDIHNTLAAKTGTDLVYVPFEVENNKVGDAVKGALALDILGLNVTVPHKSAVIPYLAEIDPVAERIGAVNTLVRTADGSGFKGYNTDYYGIKKSFEHEKVKLKGKSVIILGAGGISKPAAYLCAEEGAKEVFILNRTLANAVKLSSDVNDFAGKDLCKAMELSDYKKLPSDRTYICFQMTSVGLMPDSDKAVIEDPDFYSLIEVGYDAVYRPFKTKFLRYCEEAGAYVITGLRTLLYQGICAYELWNDTKISDKDCEEVYRKLLETLLGGENIILVGFMGSGKSAVSRTLSRFFGYDKIDSDAAIEKEQGRKIKDIFAEEGEEYFRDIETKYLESLIESGRKNMVLAVGGGLPLREKNRELLKKIGTVVYLKATPETVYKRVKRDTSRPLLNTEDKLARIRELLDSRREIYESAADVVVSTDGKNIKRVAVEVAETVL